MKTQRPEDENSPDVQGMLGRQCCFGAALREPWKCTRPLRRRGPIICEYPKGLGKRLFVFQPVGGSDVLRGPRMVSPPGVSDGAHDPLRDLAELIRSSACIWYLTRGWSRRGVSPRTGMDSRDGQETRHSDVPMAGSVAACVCKNLSEGTLGYDDGSDVPMNPNLKRWGR